MSVWLSVYVFSPCSHQAFRPKLVQHIRRRKLNKHKKVSDLEEPIEGGRREGGREGGKASILWHW